LNSDNPYQPPTTQVETAAKSSDDIWTFIEPQSVPVGRSLSWIGQGFSFFGRNAGTWIVITIIYLLVLLFSSFIPFATTILQPILAGGLMLGLYAQDNGQDIEIRHLFEGFSVCVDKLAIFGALLIGIAILTTIVFAILFLIGFFVVLGLNESGADSQIAIIIMVTIAVPVVLIVSLLFGALSWFGPPLIILHNKPVGDAVKLSLLALKRNIGAFIIFSFFAFLLVVLVAFTLYIGLLVLMPVLFGATYASWKDIFTNAPSQ